MLKLNKIIFCAVTLLGSQQSQAISIANDLFDFNTYGQVGTDFGSNFNYYYDEKTKIVSKSSVKNYDQRYKGAIDSAYVDRKVNSNWNVRVGKLPLIDNVDYQKLGEDIKKITIDDKINNYDGINLRYKKSLDDGDLYVSNIMGRFKTTRDEDSYYDNVIGSNIVFKHDYYKLRFGHSIIEPSVNKRDLNYSEHSKGQISSVEFNYYMGDFKHSNEIIKKNYYYDEKVINSFRTNLSYSGVQNVTPFAEFVQEMDQWNNGQQVFSSGLQFQFKDNLKVTSNCKKIYRTYSDYEDVNQDSNQDLVLSLGLTLKY